MPTGIYRRTKEYIEKLKSCNNSSWFQKGHKINLGKKNALGKHWKVKNTSNYKGKVISSQGFQKGHKGIGNVFSPGHEVSQNTIDRAREVNKGNKYNLGKKRSEKTKKKLSESHKGKKQTEEAKRKIREYNIRTGKQPPIMWGKDNPNWNNGSSFEPYSPDWTETLREMMRQRDNYICQKCGKTQKEEIKTIGCKLTIHHIDYDKKNCNPDNLITLCRRCNLKANFNREYWKEYFYQINGQKT